MKTDFIVTGMSCAACVSRVEKAAKSVAGVMNVTVNLVTGDLRVEGDFDVQKIIKAVNGAGYGARVRSEKDNSGDAQKKERKAGVKDRVIRLMISASVLVFLFIEAMCYNMDMSLFKGSSPREAALISGIIQAVLSLEIILVNYKIFVSGFKGLIKLSPNMDSLVATGVAASFCYSLVLLIICILSEDPSLRPVYYFESSGMILTFMGIGKLLEALAKGKAANSVSALRNLVPDSCTVIADGIETVVKTSAVRTGQTVLIRPGERIALDGEIISGSTELDESAVTGESVPVFKKPGDQVISGTVNITGVVKARVISAAGETTVDRMAELVRQISSTKAPIAKTADKVAAVFVPAVMLIALAVFAIWLIAGKDLGFSLERAVSVLVVSCPCALGLATPVAIICGSAASAKRGVLFKTSESLEVCGRVKTVIFDKTGTITQGRMYVEKAEPANGFDEKDLISTAALCEEGGTHPIAAAIVSCAKEKYGFIEGSVSGDRRFIPGEGAKLVFDDGTEAFCGKAAFIPVSSDFGNDTISDFAGSVVYVSKGNAFLGRVYLSDKLSPGAGECMTKLHAKRISTVMLTGDNVRAAAAVSALVGIDDYKAGLLPHEKSEAVTAITDGGSVRTAMVGDGINDAPALTAASVGIAIGRGTDVAMEAADVVVTGSSLTQISGAVFIAERTLAVIYENLFWAFGYNIIGIPLAAGLFSLINSSLLLTPAFSSVAMSVSSVLVVTNSLRLLAMGNKCFGKLEKSQKTSVNTPGESCSCLTENSECDTMKTEENACRSACDDDGSLCGINDNLSAAGDTVDERSEGVSKMIRTTVEVKGMMCHNCERHVNKAVQEAFDVVSVESSLEKNETVIISASKLDEERLLGVIREEGYEPGRIVAE
ncbi:MAG: heavy metal translocating P-type ATPase [Clostridia bacterium]|nr:heavy metal translocating P-type ATPase [Clostridia bacterium]